MRVDVLTGTTTDEYLPAPKNAFKVRMDSMGKA